MNNDSNIYGKIAEIVKSSDLRLIKAKQIAELIRDSRHYRWVGIYDIDEREIFAMAWSGNEAPAFPRFPRENGLNGTAVSSRSTVIANDVANDPRYLTTFGSTQSEVVVPVADPDSRSVLGTIDVESIERNAFGDADREFLEECARLIHPLWD